VQPNGGGAPKAGNFFLDTQKWVRKTAVSKWKIGKLMLRASLEAWIKIAT
jgi:hypothetical protein